MPHLFLSIPCPTKLSITCITSCQSSTITLSMSKLIELSQHVHINHQYEPTNQVTLFLDMLESNSQMSPQPNTLINVPENSQEIIALDNDISTRLPTQIQNLASYQHATNITSLMQDTRDCPHVTNPSIISLSMIDLSLSPSFHNNRPTQHPLQNEH